MNVIRGSSVPNKVQQIKTFDSDILFTSGLDNWLVECPVGNVLIQMLALAADLLKIWIDGFAVVQDLILTWML